MPGRGARRVRQGDQLEGSAVAAERERAAHDLVEFLEREELGDGEFAHGNDELRSQEVDFVIHPGRTIPNLVGRGDAVAACGSFAGETATNGREVNLRADL